eukprot:TRINITY_DN3174_c0_g1_i5.p1 TRINITY_DN3174_c0_g1~~TRINITY_DN3174_c0_g1_i5.p1  ORF type:complete len:106 (-),score=11.08 TRINITY_DN3174_c0_g1_i5:282-599(-)
MEWRLCEGMPAYQAISGLVVVIDSTRRQDILDTKDFLFRFFASDTNYRSVMILCNKKDLSNSLSLFRIASLLDTSSWFGSWDIYDFIATESQDFPLNQWLNKLLK